MKIIMENWRGYVAEAQENEKVSDIMDQAFDHLVKSLKKVEPGDPEKEVDEAVALAAAGAVLAAPQVLEIVGETINWIVPRIKGLMGDTTPADNTAFGNKLLAISQELHHKYLTPLQFVVKRLFPDKDEGWTHTWADRLFHLIVATFLISAGLGAYKAFSSAAEASSSTFVVGVIESAMSAIKSNEIWEFLTGT